MVVRSLRIEEIRLPLGRVAPQVVNCKVGMKYWKRRIASIARLAPQGDRWELAVHKELASTALDRRQDIVAVAGMTERSHLLDRRPAVGEHRNTYRLAREKDHCIAQKPGHIPARSVHNKRSLLPEVGCQIALAYSRQCKSYWDAEP